MSPIIEVHDLTKTYGSLTAVDHVSFAVDKGTLFGFLGPNGAGKSTTISMLTTILAPQSGAVAYAIIDDDPRLLGQDDADIRSRIGVVFQDNLLDKTLTVRDNLDTRARLYGLPGAGDLVAALHLDEIMSQRYGTLSGGQRRRVDIARALLATPEILFLDEPTTGLDPQSRNLVWETLDALRLRFGLTVFLTTHYMEEAERADQVTVIDRGRIIAAGTPGALRAAHSHDRLKLRGGPALEEALTTAGTPWTRRQDVVEIDLESAFRALDIIDAHRALIQDFEVVHGTMDDVFLNLTGATLREN